MDPYSDRLYIGDITPGGAGVVLYTVPVDERHVLRDIRLRVDVAGLVQLYVVTPGSEVGMIIRRSFALDELYRETETRPTLRAGDDLLLYAPAGVAVTAYISGYRLDA